MNTPVKIVIGVAVLGGLAGLGYWQMPKWFPQASRDGEVEFASASALSMTEIIQTRHADVEGTAGCDVRLLYPQIADDGSLAISSEAREKMNEAIVKQVTDFLSTNTVSLDEAATAFVTSCQTDLAEAMSWTDDMADDPYVSLTNGWESEIGYSIKLNDGKYLSLGIANFLSTGGAHPSITELFLTFEVATGNVVGLRDLLAADQLTAFEVKEKQWLVDNMADQIFEELTSEFSAYIAVPTQEATDRYVDDAMVYLTATDIVTFYNPYIIAPYTVGPIEVMIAR
jgi:hypothetical protein